MMLFTNFNNHYFILRSYIFEVKFRVNYGYNAIAFNFSSDIPIYFTPFID